MMEITGKIIEYEHENGDRYKLLFGIKTVTWECLRGSVAGSSGTYSYGAIEIAPNNLFISWSEEDGKVMSIVANVQIDTLYCCDTQGDTRHFWKGIIKRFSNASIIHA